MGTELMVHRVTRIKVMVSQPKTDVVGKNYCTGHINIESEDGDVKVVTFGVGVEEGSDIPAVTAVYPFVELERPEVESTGEA